MNVPCELMDPVYDNIQNTITKGYILKKPVLNPQTGTLDKYEFIPFDKNQMTYIHSGIWNQDKTIRLPFVENARRAYRQLLLMEDAIIIYRLVRAPERLVFNVDVSNMSPPKAEAYLRKLIKIIGPGRHMTPLLVVTEKHRHLTHSQCLIVFGLLNDREVKGPR